MMTETELSRQLQTTLLTYQGYFKKQQMDAFEKRAEVSVTRWDAVGEI